MPVEFLTDEQADAYGKFHEEPTRPELERFFAASCTGGRGRTLLREFVQLGEQAGRIQALEPPADAARGMWDAGSG
ncbi:hypothetical protein [Streptomyces canus]|uniref:hypothetical protein n=1 Tax=Streptomyces canus TaxID=58343 RepID=UPI002E2AB981|nr:hypothetical protein [Streptomyces canus]